MLWLGVEVWWVFFFFLQPIDLIYGTSVLVYMCVCVCVYIVRVWCVYVCILCVCLCMYKSAFVYCMCVYVWFVCVCVVCVFCVYIVSVVSVLYVCVCGVFVCTCTCVFVVCMNVCVPYSYFCLLSSSHYSFYPSFILLSLLFLANKHTQNTQKNCIHHRHTQTHM